MSTENESPNAGNGHEETTDLNNPVNLVSEKIRELDKDRSFILLSKLMKEHIHRVLYVNGIYNRMDMKLIICNGDFPYNVTEELTGEKYHKFMLDVFALEFQFYCEHNMNADSFEFIFNSKNIPNYRRAL